MKPLFVATEAAEAARPRHRRTAEQRDERAPLHSITSSAKRPALRKSFAAFAADTKVA
jgi:hypothetical protein